MVFVNTIPMVRADYIDSFAQRCRSKETEVLKRYHRMLKPKGAIDLFKYLYSSRMPKDSAVLRVLERREYNLERKV